jgi:hypothetical protein
MIADWACLVAASSSTPEAVSAPIQKQNPEAAAVAELGARLQLLALLQEAWGRAHLD